jgi:internalin A
MQNSITSTPEWALEKIRKAKVEGFPVLELSGTYRSEQEKLVEFPNEIFELSGITRLYLDGNSLTILPETISQLQNLTELKLDGNQLSTLSESITRLPNLTHLYLRENQLSSLPETITRLQNLTWLGLTYNQFSTLPETITQLQNLTILELDHNQLSAIPETITRLQNLTWLVLSFNQLSTLPETVTRLPSLITLVLSSNGLSTLPETITRLQNLTRLDLGINQFSTLPETITRLPNLTWLDLTYNQFSTLPETITRLPNLTHLDLSRNQFSTLPEAITQLPNLTFLDLSFNQLGTLPETITRLHNLTNLYLLDNKLSTLPETISQLSNLQDLGLSGNELSSLPESITRLPNLRSWSLDKNPLISPPVEIVVQGIEAIRQYFRQLNQEGTDYLYEAKLLILGEGEAGKTTFANKIIDSNYVLKEEDSTKGVDVLKWSFPTEGGKEFKVNIWDFGGQEIYHATHQFFLTRRSLYTLVADIRKGDSNYDYWLNMEELLSDGSPLLIIKNEKQERHLEIDERQLKGQFKGLKEVLATNLATNRGLEEVKDEIKHQLRKLPHIGTPLPKTWVRVRKQLEKDPRNYISLEYYNAICKENGVSESEDRKQVSEYLHDIGVFLHFQKDPLLKRTIILKPKWGTDAVYKVLDNKTVSQSLGRFTRADLDTIWNEPEYEDMRDELLQLMMKFKLCYEIPTQRGTYIAPQLLSENKPEYEWDDEKNLLLRYEYKFMPKGFLTQFIVAVHPDIWQQRIVWKTGLVMEQDRTRAEVVEDYGRREIHVRVAGEQKRDLMMRIRQCLRDIHGTYEQLKYDELIQCNCSTCQDSQEPHFYKVAVLRNFMANKKLEIQCQKGFEMVNVMGLLGDVIDPSKWSEKDGIYIENYYARGDNKMTEINQKIEHSTVHGSVVAAESIQHSFNTIQKADINDDLKEQLSQLTQAVDAMVKEKLTEQPEQAEKVGVYMQRLSEEATKEKPDSEWYSVSIDGLTKAAQNLGKVGDAVIELAGKVRKVLTGGLI